MKETGGMMIGDTFSTVTIHDASETGDVRANAVKDELPPFPVVDTSAKPKLPYGTEEYRRVDTET
jgi:hypothetical protein